MRDVVSRVCFHCEQVLAQLVFRAALPAIHTRGIRRAFNSRHLTWHGLLLFLFGGGRLGVGNASAAEAQATGNCRRAKSRRVTRAEVWHEGCNMASFSRARNNRRK